MRAWKPFMSGVCAFALSLHLAGCGSGTPEIPDELLQDNGAVVEGYPTGPYGAEVGDTVENFSFEGYDNPEESRDIGPISIADFHDPDGEKGINLILLNTSAIWCQACIIEHDTLPERVNELGAQGLRVVSALFQDGSGEPAGVQELDFWVDNFDVNFTMVLDPSFQMERYGPAETPPANVIVDPTNMEILAVFIGNQEGPMWEFIERELEARN